MYVVMYYLIHVYYRNAHIKQLTVVLNIRPETRWMRL